MHEFSLCQNIIDIVIPSVPKDRQAKSIVLTIGALSQVDVDSLAFWFPVAAKNTVLAKTKLHIETEAAYATCHTCQKHYAIQTLYDACPHCDCGGNPVVSGQRLQVKSVEIE